MLPLKSESQDTIDILFSSLLSPGNLFQVKYFSEITPLPFSCSFVLLIKQLILVTQEWAQMLPDSEAVLDTSFSVEAISLY